MNVFDYFLVSPMTLPTPIALVAMYRTRRAVAQWQAENPDGVVSSWIGTRGAVIGGAVLVLLAANYLYRVAQTGEPLYGVPMTMITPVAFLAFFAPVIGAGKNGVFKTTIRGTLLPSPWSDVISVKEVRKSVSNILLKGGEAITVNSAMPGGNKILLMVRDRLGALAAA